MTMQRRPTTLKGIAQASGYSYRVVAEVMSGRPSGAKLPYSEKARERILATARELGYRPNRTARNFVARNHGVIDVICATVHALNADFMHGLLEAAKVRHGITVNLEEIQDWRHHAPRCLKEDAVDGVVLINATNDDLDDNLGRLALPLVRLNCNRRNKPGCITLDEEGGMRLLAEAMAAAGRRRLLVPLNDDGHFSGAVRRRELLRLTAALGMDAPVFTSTAYEMGTDGIQERFHDLLRDNPDIDAVVAHEHLLGPLYRACRRLGRGIGDDLAVTCLHPGRLAPAIFPGPGLLGVSELELGCLAIDTLARIIGGDLVPAQSVPYHYQPGEVPDAIALHQQAQSR
jgi:DNA-binding LacI/PurR family transcriptional regulator